MACGSKMRSTRSISCTWYCTVRRSSKHQVAFGPTASCRSTLCCSTRVRNAGRSRAYCSSVSRSAGVRLFVAAMTLESISDAQQPQRVLRGAPVRQAACDLLAGHRAVAAVVIALRRLHALHHRAADPDRGGAKALLYAVGAVVPGATLDRLNPCACFKVEGVAHRQAEGPHPQVAGHVVAHLAERGAK